MVKRLLYLLTTLPAFAIPEILVAQAGTARSTAQTNGALDSFFGARRDTYRPCCRFCCRSGTVHFYAHPVVTAQVSKNFIYIFSLRGKAVVRGEEEAYLDQITPEVQ